MDDYHTGGARCRWGKAHFIRGANMGDYVETIVVPEVFVTDIAGIERIGDVVRLILTVPQGVGGEANQNVVMARLLVPVSSLAEAIRKLAAVQAGGRH